MSCYLQGGASLVLIQTADAFHAVWHRRTAVMGLLYQALQELTQNRYSNGGFVHNIDHPWTLCCHFREWFLLLNLTDRPRALQDQSILRRIKQEILYQISTTQLSTLCFPFKIILWSQMFIISLNLMELTQGRWGNELCKLRLFKFCFFT